VEAPSRPSPTPAVERTGAELVALAPPPPRIVTRRRLPRTGLIAGRGAPDGEPPEAWVPLATRRQAWSHRRRRRHVLLAVAIALAFFPPMWAVYLVAWVFWRRRPQQRSMRLVRQGVRALEADQKGLALRRFQDAHLLDPANNDALYWLGLLLSQQGRHAEAEEALSLVAERVPGLPEVEASLAEAYVAMGEPESAVYHAQRLLDAAPYAPEALLKLADAFEAGGRLDLAIEALERAPVYGRRMPAPLVPVHYRLGALHEQQGDPERALHHFKRVYARDIGYEDVRARVAALEARRSR
jgi:tetratricopeptide (TPR) repeat protein